MQTLKKHHQKKVNLLPRKSLQRDLFPSLTEKILQTGKYLKVTTGTGKSLDGVIDYDAESEATGDKSLWSEKSYKNFILSVDWRIKETPWNNPRVPLILPSGDHKLNEKGEEITMIVPDSDSGILFRGRGKQQVNIWCWPIGSGEVYGYRMDKSMSPEVRRGVTPITNADHNIGEWNTFVITVKGDRSVSCIEWSDCNKKCLPAGPSG